MPINGRIVIYEKWNDIHLVIISSWGGHRDPEAGCVFEDYSKLQNAILSSLCFRVLHYLPSS